MLLETASICLKPLWKQTNRSTNSEKMFLTIYYFKVHCTKIKDFCESSDHLDIIGLHRGIYVNVFLISNRIVFDYSCANFNNECGTGLA